MDVVAKLAKVSFADANLIYEYACYSQQGGQAHRTGVVRAAGAPGPDRTSTAANYKPRHGDTVSVPVPFNVLQTLLNRGFVDQAFFHRERNSALDEYKAERGYYPLFICADEKYGFRASKFFAGYPVLALTELQIQDQLHTAELQTFINECRTNRAGPAARTEEQVTALNKASVAKCEDALRALANEEVGVPNTRAKWQELLADTKDAVKNNQSADHLISTYSIEPSGASVVTRIRNLKRVAVVQLAEAQSGRKRKAAALGKAEAKRAKRKRGSDSPEHVAREGLRSSPPPLATAAVLLEAAKTGRDTPHHRT